MSERLESYDPNPHGSVAMNALSKIVGALRNIPVCVQEGLEACFLGAPTIPSQRQPESDQSNR